MLRSRSSLSAVRRIQLTSPRVPGCPACSRSYVAPTVTRGHPPAAAFAEASHDSSSTYSYRPREPEPPHVFNPLSSSSSSSSSSYSPSSSSSSANASSSSSSSSSSLPPMGHGPSHRIRLPAPLPTDVSAPLASLQAELYKPTSTIDTIAMLSICSSRPEFVPRAYQIFTQLLSDARNGLARIPEAEVWANVIKGVALLATPSKEIGKDMTARMWRSRAEQLVWKWEESQNVKSRTPALARGGISVYRRWMAGLVQANSPLEQLLPYIEHPDLGVEALLEGMQKADLDVALDQLAALAKRSAQGDLASKVQELKGIEQHRREILEREVIADVKPVLELASKVSQRKLSAATESKEVDIQDAAPRDPMARFAITNLRQTLAHISTPLTAYNRQMQLEHASYQAAEAELAHAAKQMESTDVADAQRLQRDVLQSIMHRWHGLLTTHLTREIAAMKERVAADPKLEIAPPKWNSTAKVKDSTLVLYLSVLPPKRLALITILEIMRMIGSGGITDGMKTLRGLISVGKAVETEHRAETIRSVAGTDSILWQQAIDSQTQKPSRKSVGNVWARIGKDREVNGIFADEGLSSDPAENLRSVWTPPWSQMVQMSVGSYLVDALIGVAKVNRTGTDPVTGEKVREEQPAFTHSYEYVRGRKLGIIKLNPVVAARLAGDSIRQVIHPKHLPMLVPPRAWRNWNDGAYLATPVTVMRFKESVEQANYLRSASKADHLQPVFHGLDVLSSTPWAINRQVFDVVLEAWNTGEAIGDIPAASDKAVYDFPEKPDPRENDPAKRSGYVERLKAATLQQRKDHSERCKYNYNLEIARSYLNDVFYIPHNMDFRGRAYPIPPHLSPVGDDLCRGLLTFGTKRPLGETGLKWLQIHLANVYGFDKASFEERARFAQDHEADIFDSADRPLDGNRWWLAAEDPWQCLATCFDLAAALRSADPTKYESALPVHQDGTCNGMQHYAALGGDVRGAKAVNLLNGDRPADIYTGVADLVNKSIEEDRKANVPIALLIQGPLGRKVVKQTVMTTVYGVTFIGARDQIAKQIVARGGIRQEDVYAVSGYVAKKVLSSIGDLFAGARAIQDWLTLSARLIARSIPADRIQASLSLPDESIRRGPGPASKKKAAGARLMRELMSSVIWTSPLGLPVVQPYRKAAKKQVMTSLQTVFIHDPNAPAEVSPQKQATAFPPNFIHSLDATHMLLTAVQCNQSNITFASVHDSYWTHAATVEPMSEVIRDTFIHLHTQDLIGELREEFLDRYGDNRILVENAKRIKASESRRKDRLESASRPTNTPLEVGALADLDPAALTDAETELVDADGEDAVDSQVGEEEEAESKASSKSIQGLTPADLEALAATAGSKAVPEEMIGTQKFVRFSDVLPPAPQRGVLDVQRIRESAYFFS